MKVTVKCFKKVDKFSEETGELISTDFNLTMKIDYYGDIRKVVDNSSERIDVDIYYNGGTSEWVHPSGYDSHTVSVESVDEW